MTKCTISPQIREKLGFLFGASLAIFALVSVISYLGIFEYFQQTTKSGIRISRSVARYEEKLTCLNAELEPDAVVGFITLIPSAQATEYHQLTQFALVPILVEYSAENSLVVGYVPGSDDIETIQTMYPDYQVVKDCQNTIVLFERIP